MAEKEVKKSNAFNLEMEYAVINGTAEADTIKSVAGIANWIDGGAGADDITGVNAGDMLAGNQGDDVITAAKAKGAVEIYGGENNDSLTGSKYGDYISGGDDEDIIRGGKGNDILRGNTPTAEPTNPDDNAKDTFLFYKGDGQDEIRDIAKDDVIKFADRTNFNGLSFAKVGEDLVISDEKKGDKITVKASNFVDSIDDVNFVLKNKEYDLDWKLSNVTGKNAMYNVVDGTTAKDNITAISGISNWINAGEGNDKITGKNAGDMLAGNEGNDTISASNAKGGVEIYGGENNDSLTGSKYSDYIAGGDGEDIIRGGKGNDILRGNTPTAETTNPDDNAKDTFLFYKGDGQDVIRDATSLDVIKFADRKNLDGLNYAKDGNDLVISDKYNNITVEGYFASENAVDTIEVKGGKTYSLDSLFDSHEFKYSNVEEKEIMYSVNNGTAEADTIKSVAGIANWIEGGVGDDVITGINEYDMLAGNEGNDTISAANAKGGVEIYGGENNDSLTGSKYSDYIAGGDGEDIIRGGKGNDILRGNTPTAEATNPDDNAKDTFLFYKGDGQDEIRDIAKDDVIKFADVNSFTQKLVGDDLVISYNGGKDSITIDNYLSNISDFTIETKNGKQYSANVEKLQADVASWLSDTGYADVATGLANGTDEQVAKLVAVFEENIFQEIPAV